MINKRVRIIAGRSGYLERRRPALRAWAYRVGIAVGSFSKNRYILVKNSHKWGIELALVLVYNRHVKDYFVFLLDMLLNQLSKNCTADKISYVKDDKISIILERYKYA